MKNRRLKLIVAAAALALALSWIATLRFAPPALESYLKKREGSGDLDAREKLRVDVSVLSLPAPFFLKAEWSASQRPYTYRHFTAWFLWLPSDQIYQISKGTGEISK
jgi:hypothetical protein